MGCALFCTTKRKRDAMPTITLVDGRLVEMPFRLPPRDNLSVIAFPDWVAAPTPCKWSSMTLVTRNTHGIKTNVWRYRTAPLHTIRHDDGTLQMVETTMYADRKVTS
jgi:hypothetical protein